MSWRFLHSKTHRPAEVSGFGMVELMVSISIMAIVTGVIIVRQSSFNSAVLLRNQAYEIALAMREVQLNAVSTIGFSGEFRTVLGVHFDTSNDDTYRIFRDGDGDRYYDGVSEEFGVQSLVDDRFEVRGIRTITNGVPTTRTALSVVFERPNFDARFFIGSSAEVNASSVEIDVSRRGITGDAITDVRTIEITSTGQIAVQ